MKIKKIEDLPAWAADMDHYEFCAQFYCSGLDRFRLKTWLKEHALEYHLISSMMHQASRNDVTDGNVVISFKNRNDILLFKLSWDESIKNEPVRHARASLLMPLFHKRPLSGVSQGIEPARQSSTDKISRNQPGSPEE